MGTLDGMSAVIAGGPAAGALMPLGCVLCHAWRQALRFTAKTGEKKYRSRTPPFIDCIVYLLTLSLAN